MTAAAVANRDGVRISDGAANNTIGGTAGSTDNEIAHNTGRGIWISDGTGNRVSQNAIHDNGALGISIGGQAATPNDLDDADTGANNLQNFPVITATSFDDGSLDIAYSIPTIAGNSAFPISVEFFLADGDGEEGETFLGQHNYTSPGTKNTSIAAGTARAAQTIVATATDADGNTSEFSAGVVIDGPVIQIAEIPDYGVDGFIRGTVTGVDPSMYVVAPYIQIEGVGWWTKPTFASPTVPINPDGSFEANVAAPGTLDNRATIFAAAIIPQGAAPPQASGAPRIPAALGDLAVAIDTVERFGRTIDFAGHTWGVKEAPAAVGPGDNVFSNEVTDVFVDQDGLHLTVNFHDGAWWATEVVLLDKLGHGTYSFQTDSELDDLDVNVTFGAFTWDPYGDDESGASQHREIDFEDGRWGNAGDPTNAQTVVQPFDTPGNLHRYTIPDLSGDAALTRFFTWRKDQIEFVALTGHHATDNFPAGAVIDQNIYIHDPAANHFVPTEGRESFRFNLWIIGGQTEPADGQSVEVVINDFDFVPLNPPALLAVGGPASGTVDDRVPLGEAELLPTVAAAIGRFGRLGLTPDLFANVEFAIADLPGATLGRATSSLVTVDINAAGYGWFIDATPWDDIEFERPDDRTAGRMDLLSVVMHELGHVLGLPHLYDDAFEDELMYAWLEPGLRKPASNAILDIAFERL